MNDTDEILVLEPVDDDGDYEYEDVTALEDEPKRRFGWPVAMGAGLLIGLAIATGISWYFRPAAYDASALEAQIADLRSDMTTLQNEPDPVIPTVNLQPITRRLDALEARPTVDPLSDEIVSRLEALQAEGFELPEMPDIPDVSALEARISELEATVQSQASQISAMPAGGATIAPASEPFIDPDTLPRFPAQLLRDGASEMGGSGFIKRTFSRHVRVRGSNTPDVLISGIESDLANGKPRAALAKFDRLPSQLRSLARAWRANMEDALQ